MRRSYKFRLYPSKREEEQLCWTLDKCRFVYNQMLERLNKQKKPNRIELQSSIPKLKEAYPRLKSVYSKVLQYEPYRLFSNLVALSRLKKKGKKVGILFGPEASGLSNDEISCANYLVKIPSNKNFSSSNFI